MKTASMIIRTSGFVFLTIPVKFSGAIPASMTSIFGIFLSLRVSAIYGPIASSPPSLFPIQRIVYFFISSPPFQSIFCIMNPLIE